MASENQIFSREMILSAYKAALHLSRTLYKSTLFMQNKANLLDTQMNVSSVKTKDYSNEQRTMNNERLCKTKPIKPNFKLFAAEVVRRKLCSVTVYPIKGSLYLREVEMVYKYMLI